MTSYLMEPRGDDDGRTWITMDWACLVSLVSKETMGGGGAIGPGGWCR